MPGRFWNTHRTQTLENQGLSSNEGCRKMPGRIATRPGKNRHPLELGTVKKESYRRDVLPGERVPGHVGHAKNFRTLVSGPDFRTRETLVSAPPNLGSLVLTLDPQNPRTWGVLGTPSPAQILASQQGAIAAAHKNSPPDSPHTCHTMRSVVPTHIDRTLGHTMPHCHTFL